MSTSKATVAILRTYCAIIGVWICLAAINALLIKTGFHTGAPLFFPISIFSGPVLHLSGMPYLLLFLILLAWTVKSDAAFNRYQISLVGLVLIILGNLGQGNMDTAFLKPFYDTGIQYYHDALKITSWQEWLESFNINQSTFFDHSRTHPPFAVLIHYFLLKAPGNSTLLLSMTFLSLSSVSVLLVWQIFKALHVPLRERNLLALLFAVVPAVNIYTAVSLDGLILTAATLFLLGMVRLLQEERISIAGISLFGSGLIITNLLTYGGVFLIAVAGIQGIREHYLGRKHVVTTALTSSLTALALVFLAIDYFFGYNHIRGFITASALENPNGFRGLSEPLVYLSTRIECISEIALFLSLGCLAMVVQPDRLKTLILNWRRVDTGLMISGVMTLLAMVMAGAFRTGETARSALFIYPYLMLAFTGTNSPMLKNLILLAGLQTFGMQLFGSYFW